MPSNEDGGLVVETLARHEASGAHSGDDAHDEVAGLDVPLLLPVHGPEENLLHWVDGDARRATRRGAREHRGSPGEGGGQWEAWWQRARRAGVQRRRVQVAP
ncbi:hypothetical protein B0H14DRAFT_2602770 [Mycena olivaceomarginata]|nr:hypothetical protein B0H14DRAFT_2602770 [Mycena olivaceomarginata]